MTETPAPDDFELPDVDAMEEYVTRLQAGAVILYSLLNEIHTLHLPDENNNCPHYVSSCKIFFWKINPPTLHKQQRPTMNLSRHLLIISL
jgi:hypothetical protein